MKRRIPGSRTPNEVDVLVGKNMKALRQARKLTLQDIADHLGVSIQQILKYENGVSRVSAGLLPSIADILGVEIGDLFRENAQRRQAKR